MRDWFISKALKSSRSLSEVINELTEEEILHVLQIEVESGARSVMVERLIRKAAEVHNRSYLKSLKEKFHGTSQKHHPHPR